MNSFTLICPCGQSMSVPESAVGRTGLCPACGKELQITRDRLRDGPGKRRGGGLLSRRNSLQVTKNNENREEAWRKFATAVDLYNNKRYAEALTLLNALQQVFPGNPHVEAAQVQCAEALKDATSPVLQYDGAPVAETTLSEELVKGVVLKKMLNGGTEEIQLQAAELAARLLGLFPQPHSSPEMPSPIIFAEEQHDKNGTNGGASPKAAKRKRSVEEIP